MRFLTNWIYFGLISVISFTDGQDSETEQMIQDAMICFTLNTAARYFKLRENEANKNFIFSPLDLYATTGLAYLGSVEETRTKLATELGKPKTTINARTRRQNNIIFRRVHATIGGLLKKVRGSKNAAIGTGIGVYVDKEYAIKSTYMQDAKCFYDVDVKCADFKNNNKQAVEYINANIKNSTFDSISDFFDNPLSTETINVFTSSLAVVTNWKYMFNPCDNYETEFHTRPDGCDNSKSCMMMNQQTIPIYKNEKVTAIGIPTAAENIIFYIILPREGYPVEQLITNPDKDLIVDILRSSQPCQVRYSIPKFSLTETLDYLAALKLSNFDNLKEDEIADCLIASYIQQKTKLQLNEEGIGGCPISAARSAPPIASKDPNANVVVVNRPFLIMTYDSNTKTILHYGVIFKPSGYQKT